MKKHKIVGGRIVKTALAVLLTAWICRLLEMPSVFAVITAIVTIEPTASDSFKKGLVRFPASAIGAALAMIFTSLLGDHPFTYMLAATLTILICHRLKLDAGILVATLTAVAMIPTTHDHFLFSFVERLGTTTIGLSVSTIINFVILPPNYASIITTKTSALLEQTGKLLHTISDDILKYHTIHKATEKTFHHSLKELENIETLCQFQRDEWKYHRYSRKEMRSFHYEHKKTAILRQMYYHLGNLMYCHDHNPNCSPDELESILTAVTSIQNVLADPNYKIPENHYENMRHILERFWEHKEELQHVSPTKFQHTFSGKSVFLFELLSIHDLLEELQQIHHVEIRPRIH